MGVASRRARCVIAVGTLAVELMLQPVMAAEQSPRCDDFAEVKSGYVAIQNNVWQREDVKGTQCLTEKGWTWDWPVVDPAKVRSFPAAYFGQRPWQQQSTFKDLPIRIADLRSLVVDYAFTSSQVGISNTAFDIWATRSATCSDGSDIAAELMIWLSHSPELSPGGTPVGTIEIDGRGYDLFVTESTPVLRVNFMAHSYEPQGSIDVRKFIDALGKDLTISPDFYLRSVELGNEIISGKGETEITSLAARLNQ